MLSGVSTSTGASYAVQLAQTSALERSLFSLGSAVQSGDLNSANSILTGIIKANPQFAISGNSSDTQDPINQDFQNLASAISNNDADSARSVWTQITSDMAKDGVTSIRSPADIAAQAVAQSRASIDQAILTNVFGTSAGSTVSLIGGVGGGADVNAALNTAVSNWLTYQANGATAPVSSGTTGTTLDASA